MVIPHDLTKPGIIIEFKTVKQAKGEELEIALEKTAKLALEQIKAENYDLEVALVYYCQI